MSTLPRGGVEVLRLIESASDPANAAGEVQVYAKEVNGATQLFARDGAGNVYQIGAVGSESNYWSAPASPNAEDDEFDDGDISGWSTTGTWSTAVAPDILATFAAGNIRYDVGGQRKSWVRAQPPADSVTYYMHKTFSGGGELPDGTYWCRLGSMFRQAIVNNDGNLLFGLMGTSGGVPDANNGLRFWQTETDGGSIEVQCWINDNNPAQTSAAQTGTLLQVGNHFGYLCIIKESTTNYHMFCSGGEGCWLHLASWTYTGGQTIDRVVFGVKNVVTVAPGNLVMGWDFFRYNTSKQLP